MTGLRAGASGQTSDDANLSSCVVLSGGHERLLFVVGGSLLQAVKQDPHVAVGQVAQGGGVAVAVFTAPVVVGARAG